MKVEVKKIDALRREMKFEVPKERVSQALKEIFDEISKVSKIRGFRPGKAPRNIVESEHGALAHEETIKKIIPEVYREAIEQEKLDVLDSPEIDDVEFKDGLIRFTARVDIKPEIKLKNYKGIKVTRKSSKVTDEELVKTLEYFQKSVQGNNAEKETVLDDQFAKSLGYPNLAEFKSSLTRQMEMDKDRQNRMQIEEQIIEFLLKENTLSAPRTLVSRQLEHHLHQVHERMKSQGIAHDEIHKRQDEMRSDLEKSAEKDVKVYLILDAIAKAEGIVASHDHESVPAKVMAFLLKEAHWEDAKSQA